MSISARILPVPRAADFEVPPPFPPCGMFPCKRRSQTHLSAVVFPLDQRPLEGHAPPRDVDVLATRVHKLRQRETAIHRDKRASFSVVGGVEAHGQFHLPTIGEAGKSDVWQLRVCNSVQIVRKTLGSRAQGRLSRWFPTWAGTGQVGSSAFDETYV